MAKRPVPSVEETNNQIDKAVRRELRKPLLVGTFALTALFVGNRIDNSHQAEADRAQSQLEQAYDALPESYQNAADTYFAEGELPKGASRAMTSAVEELDDISDHQRSEDNAGSLLNFVGGIAGIYAGVKLFGLAAGRWLARDEVKREHPELAMERISSQAGRLVEAGDLVESVDSMHDEFALPQNQHLNPAQFSQRELRTIGRDIEATEGFLLSTDALHEQARLMLDGAQWSNMIDGSGSKMSAQELLNVRLLNDLWRPTETFDSLKGWYTYRRKQVVRPHEVHAISEGELFMPDLEPINGGIGVAVGRLASYMRTYEANRERHPAGAEEAYVDTVKGAAFLDKIAPRTDDEYWMDYIEALVRGRLSTVED